MITFALFIAISWPQPTFTVFPDYLPLPNPTPADCIIVPLDNPVPKQIVAHGPVLTA